MSPGPSSKRTFLTRSDGSKIDRAATYLQQNAPGGPAISSLDVRIQPAARRGVASGRDTGDDRSYIAELEWACYGLIVMDRGQLPTATVGAATVSVTVSITDTVQSE